MNILSFDTAADFCCVLLLANGKTVDKRLVMTARDQAAILAPLTQELLDANNLKATQIDRFAVTTGPGSFTGLRVGLSFTRGLGLATAKPVLGFDHFRCYSHSLETGAPLLLVRDSKRADLFACWRKDSHLSIPFLANAGTLAALLQKEPHAKLAGDGATHVVAHDAPLQERFMSLPLEACATNAALFAERADDPSAHPPEPLYLRDADVSPPKNRP
jgi:tRNA threonylcarbamoyladenosine biosynthesis protein TsaB